MADNPYIVTPDDSEYPLRRERLDDGECQRLRALLRRWVAWSSTWPPSHMCRCGAYGDTPQSAPHAPGCIVGDTLKELGQ